MVLHMVAELLIAPGAVSSMASQAGAAPSSGNARSRSLSPQRRAQSFRPTQPQPALGVDIARVTQLTTDLATLGSVVQQLAASQTEIQRQLNLLISGQSAASVGQQSPVPPQQAAGTPSRASCLARTASECATIAWNSGQRISWADHAGLSDVHRIRCIRSQRNRDFRRNSHTSGNRATTATAGTRHCASRR